MPRVENAGGCRLHEKGGKVQEMPVHHTLEACLDAYIDAARLRERPRRLAVPRRERSDRRAFGAAVHAPACLADGPPTGARRAGITQPVGNHSFRATGITAYLANNGSLEHAQRMAAHASPRTTKALRPHRRGSDARRGREDRDLSRTRRRANRPSEPGCVAGLFSELQRAYRMRIFHGGSDGHHGAIATRGKPHPR